MAKEKMAKVCARLAIFFVPYVFANGLKGGAGL